MPYPTSYPQVSQRGPSYPVAIESIKSSDLGMSDCFPRRLTMSPFPGNTLPKFDNSLGALLIGGMLAMAYVLLYFIIKGQLAYSMAGSGVWPACRVTRILLVHQRIVVSSNLWCVLPVIRRVEKFIIYHQVAFLLLVRRRWAIGTDHEWIRTGFWIHSTRR